MDSNINIGFIYMMQSLSESVNNKYILLLTLMNIKTSIIFVPY